MHKPLFVFISFHFLWNANFSRFQKIITVLSIMGISISIFSIIIISSMMNGFENYFETNVLSFIPHAVITNKIKYVNKSQFPKKILKHMDVKKISDFITKEAIVQSNQGVFAAKIFGIDSSNYNNIESYNIKHVFSKISSGKNNSIIDEMLAKKLKIKIGDKIKLIILSNEKNYFLGNIFNQKSFTVTEIFSISNPINAYQIFINKNDCMKFFHYDQNYISGWRLWLKHPISADMKNKKHFKHHLFISDWKSKKSELFSSIKIEKNVMIMLFFLVVIVAIFNIVITLFLFIIEKQNTIAILKTQGLSSWNIMLTFFMLGMNFTIIGSVLGTIISIFLILQHHFLEFFLHVVFGNMNIPILISPWQIFCINIISIIITVIFILYPSWKATKIQPAKILTYE